MTIEPEVSSRASGATTAAVHENGASCLGHRAAQPEKNWHVPRHWFRPRRSAVRLLSSDATKVAPRAVTQPSSIPGAPIEACTAKRERLETVSQACRLGRARAGGAGLVPDWDSFPGRSVDTVVVRVLHRPFSRRRPRRSSPYRPSRTDRSSCSPSRTSRRPVGRDGREGEGAGSESS